MHRSLSLILLVLVAFGCRARQLTHPTLAVSEGSRVELGGRSDVLYVIDGRVVTRADSSGVPLAVRNLDPGRIRTIEVLKGAKAKRAYGEAGASGVVIITTTDGR
jgi:TonB-dependent SusC/RagA subfamily outer membrane receptor